MLGQSREKCFQITKIVKEIKFEVVCVLNIEAPKFPKNIPKNLSSYFFICVLLLH